MTAFNMAALSDHSSTTLMAGRDMHPAPDPLTVPADAVPVIGFWWQAGPANWFGKAPDFDAEFRERFLPVHEAAARGELDAWRTDAYGALALLILLDQFPRNAFRGTPRMYATDEQALGIAESAFAAGLNRRVDAELALFFGLPFAHSEDAGVQERSVELARREFSALDYERARHHRDIIMRFGRFPHRNTILGRQMRHDEEEFLLDGGFSG